MKEYQLPKWGWWIQIASMLGLIVFVLVAILPDAIKQNASTLYAVVFLFVLVGLFGVHFLWFQWPHKIVIHDDNTVSFYTRGSVTDMPVTDIYAVRFGRGIWLYHAKGKFAFSAAPTNSPLFEFIDEVSQRNPGFTIGSKYIRSRLGRDTR